MALQTNLLEGPVPLIELIIAAAFGLLLLLFPLWRRYPDDQGDGHALVLLPPPKLPSLRRTAAMVIVFTLFNVLYHSIRGPLAPDRLYASAVQSLAGRVVAAPAETQGFFHNFSLGLRILVVGTMLSLAVCARASVLRRLLIAVQVIWYVLAIMLFDALLTVFAVLTRIPAAPTTLVGSFLAIGLGFLAMSRLLFVNFALPKPTEVPFAPRRRLNDAATLIGCSLVGIAVSAVVTLVVYRSQNPKYFVLFAVVAPLPFAYLAYIVRSLLLWVVGSVSSEPEPEVGDDRPLIELIIPAYNEEKIILETLVAIDVAAGNYGGPVNVVLANDGSTDSTYQVASAAIDGFRFATGRVINVNHGGKSATLNSALAETTADIVIRVDADTLIDAWSLYYTPRWFRDPTIGLVEAMMWPRWTRSPFPRMRLFEELKQFGAQHRILQGVDGVNVVPGVFTAFRRQPAFELGGFTVGMNGEDGDFTFRFSRLGWRTKQDPKIIVHEDVPPTYMEIREQRVRWDRATIHNQARHGPYRAGFATPKVWFTSYHQFFSRTFAPIRLMLPFYLLITLAFVPADRNAVAFIAAAWFVGSIAFIMIETFLVTAYRFERRWPWLILWPFWQVCLMIFSTESWLSLPGRPVGFSSSPDVKVTEAVVH
jgi:cellulose synthase/poly-beta-1,6-N-acetylglucosamine synthase-like glycosyltransferase